VAFFVGAGHDINVRLSNGSTILDHVNQHRSSGAYQDILRQVGALQGKN
jgi:hypothetical protein